MSTLHITLSAHRCTFDIDGQSLVVPFGRITLDSAIASDPPRPEELINAIGSVLDHLEDVDRELPAIVSMDQAALSGDGVDVLAAVEVGTSTPLPYRLHRDAAEDVFRTLATETAAQRVHNPGLPADWVGPVLGVCIAAVAVLRYYRLEHIELVHV